MANKRLEGKVSFIRKNYGALSTKIDNKTVRLFFLVKAEMVDENGNFILGENVSFQTRNVIIRGTNVVCAYNLKPLAETQKKIEPLENKNNADYNSYKYLNFLGDKYSVDEKTNKELMEQEKIIDLFFMEWILFLEKETKKILLFVLEKSFVKSKDFIALLKQDKLTSKIIIDSLQKIKENTFFSPASDSIIYAIKINDPNDVEVIDAPLIMILEQLTLKELSLVLKVCQPLYSKNIDDDKNKLLFYITSMIQDILFIRNKVAHGNIVVPYILDDIFSPSYFYEMASVFPSWNSNSNTNDVENYPAFHFIRFQTRMLAKEGINLAGISGGPMEISLFFTKSLLINQAKKSLFSFAFLLMCVFAYWDESKFSEFMSAISSVGILGTDSSPESIYSTFPNKKNSIERELTRLLFPIFYYCGIPQQFKIFSSISLSTPYLKVE